MDLRGKVAIVTGASRGIGRGIALELARAGCAIAFNYRKREDAAQSLVHDLEAMGGKVCAVRADVTDLAEVRAFFAKVLDSFETFHILVNNAGISRDRALMNMAPEEWHEVLDTNLTGAFYCARAAITTMMKQREGRLINIASVAAFKGLPGTSNYAASKAGLIGMTKALAREVGRYGVTVNAVAPGFIDTDMVAGLSDRAREELVRQIPLGRFGQVADVAHAVRFLASEEGRYFTGQVLTMDGGLSV